MRDEPSGGDPSPVDYRVVVNHEQQYSIWRTDREIPPGWRDEGTVASKAECLNHIEVVWTDMRPLSARSAES